MNKFPHFDLLLLFCLICDHHLVNRKLQFKLKLLTVINQTLYLLILNTVLENIHTPLTKFASDSPLKNSALTLTVTFLGSMDVFWNRFIMIRLDIIHLQASKSDHPAQALSNAEFGFSSHQSLTHTNSNLNSFQKGTSCARGSGHFSY